jgi:hypothetical protein
MFQNFDTDRAFAEHSRNPFHAGVSFRGFTGSLPLRPARLLAPPARIRLGPPSPRGLYFQAFDGSVSLPVAGYDYNSDWTPPVGGTLTRWNGS